MDLSFVLRLIKESTDIVRNVRGTVSVELKATANKSAKKMLKAC